MAIVKISSRYDPERRQYVPDRYMLVGEGDFLFSKALIEESDSAYLILEGNFLRAGPYRFEVIEITGNAYVYRLFEGIVLPQG